MDFASSASSSGMRAGLVPGDASFDRGLGPRGGSRDGGVSRKPLATKGWGVSFEDEGEKRRGLVVRGRRLWCCWGVWAPG